MRRLMCAALLAWPALVSAQGIGTDFPVSQSSNWPVRSISGMAGDGRFVVAWTSYFEPSTRVVARRFDATAQPLGPEFPVSADATSKKGRAALTVRPDGAF